MPARHLHLHRLFKPPSARKGKIRTGPISILFPFSVVRDVASWPAAGVQGPFPKNVQILHPPPPPHPSPLECQFCQSTWHTPQLRESFLMSYKNAEHGTILFPLVSNETSRIKLQQNPVQGSLHDDLDALTLTALRAEFPVAFQETHTDYTYCLHIFTEFTARSHDPVPFYCLLLTMMKFQSRFYPGVTPSTWK
jgi:hypothetical protein